MKPKRSFESVVDELIAGLGSGEIVLEPNCRFYGCSHVTLKYDGRLSNVDASSRNECALALDGWMPCIMEANGHRPDEASCPLVRKVTARG